MMSAPVSALHILIQPPNVMPASRAPLGLRARFLVISFPLESLFASAIGNGPVGPQLELPSGLKTPPWLVVVSEIYEVLLLQRVPQS